jgi:hypothetical protein
MTVCPARTTTGYDYDGGFSRYTIVPARAPEVGAVNLIPDGVSFSEASLAEPLACALAGQELAGVAAGDDVVVIGTGPIIEVGRRKTRDQPVPACTEVLTAAISWRATGTGAFFVSDWVSCAELTLDVIAAANRQFGPPAAGQ